MVYISIILEQDEQNMKAMKLKIELEINPVFIFH